MIIILSIHPIKVKDRSREFCSKYQELIVIMIVSLSSFLLINSSLTKPKHLIMDKQSFAGLKGWIKGNSRNGFECQLCDSMSTSKNEKHEHITKHHSFHESCWNLPIQCAYLIILSFHYFVGIVTRLPTGSFMILINQVTLDCWYGVSKSYQNLRTSLTKDSWILMTDFLMRISMKYS